MSEGSTIEWTNATWNPVRGFTKNSPGCKHCYVETFAKRWQGIPDHAYEQGFDLRLVPKKLGEPLTWARSRLIFVNSMSDLLHQRVPDDYVRMVFEVMNHADSHVYQPLAPQRLAAHRRRAHRLAEGAQIA